MRTNAKRSAPAPEDERFMRLALQEARRAAREEEVPVGALLVCQGRVVARAHNRPIHLSDPSAHAEILALRRAARLPVGAPLVGMGRCARWRYTSASGTTCDPRMRVSRVRSGMR